MLEMDLTAQIDHALLEKETKGGITATVQRCSELNQEESLEASVEPSTETIWNIFSGQLRGFIRKRLDDPDEAEDILQEVFVKIHTRLHTLKDKNRLASWLFQITRNTLIDHLRTQSSTSALPANVPDGKESSEDNEAQHQIASYLMTLVSGLPEGYRQAVELYELAGMKQQEIGERLGLSHSGAKSRIQRGREMLKNALLDCCHFEFDRTGRIIDYRERQKCCTRHDLICS
jgi:RNA polymerase sigma-70 factor (ECF subfamily)